jgi:large subunit ribosomal protein L10
LKAREAKMLVVEELAELLKKYRVIAVCNLAKVRTIQLQELRVKFRGDILLKVAKNNLVKLAIDKVSKEKPGLEKLKEFLKDQNLLVFTDMSGFKLSILFEKNKIKLTAKAGDIAPEDVTVHKGNTGLPPGPIISEFSDVGIPTKIESGSIMITRDTVVVKAGEVISDKVAGILGKLGIKPIEAKLTIKASYEDGEVYPAETLTIDLEAYRRDLKSAVQAAQNLLVNAAIPTLETLPIMLAKAAGEALNLLVNAGIPEPQTLPLTLAKAWSEGQALAKKLSEKDESLKDLTA